MSHAHFKTCTSEFQKSYCQAHSKQGFHEVHPYWSVKRKNRKCASHFNQSSGIARARSQNWRLSTDDKSSPSASALASLDAMDSSSAKLQIPWEKQSGKRWSTLEKPNLLGNPVLFWCLFFLQVSEVSLRDPPCFLVWQLPGALILVSVKKLIGNTISNLTVFEICFLLTFFGDTSETNEVKVWLIQQTNLQKLLLSINNSLVRFMKKKNIPHIFTAS